MAEEAQAAETGYVVVELKSEDNQPADFDDLVLRIVDPTTLQENHYDPFGQNLVGIETEGRPTHRLQFNGKEKISDFGLFWNDYGARNQDGPRWSTVDPLAEKFPSVSPYAFCLNNPINVVDPDGRDAVYRIRRDGDNNISSVDVQANVLLAGEGMSAGFAQACNDLSKRVFGSAKVNGVPIYVSANFTYAPNATAAALKPGQNLLTLLSGSPDKFDRAHVSGGKQVKHESGTNIVLSQIEFSGNTGVMYPETRPVDVLHETGHFLGLSDRYFEEGGHVQGGGGPMPGYEHDLMGDVTPNLSYNHYVSFYEAAVNSGRAWSSGRMGHFPFGPIVNRRIIDKDKFGALLRP